MSNAEYEQICSELDNTRQKDHPRAYDELSQEGKEALLYWIEHAIQSAAKADDHQSSYGLKHEYERETKCYVSNAQFKGAMLVAGYQPTKKGEQYWHFAIRPMHDETRSTTKSAHQSKRGHAQTYRSTPPSEQDPRFTILVQKALASPRGNTTYAVMI